MFFPTCLYQTLLCKGPIFVLCGLHSGATLAEIYISKFLRDLGPRSCEITRPHHHLLIHFSFEFFFTE